MALYRVSLPKVTQAEVSAFLAVMNGHDPFVSTIFSEPDYSSGDHAEFNEEEGEYNVLSGV